MARWLIAACWVLSVSTSARPSFSLDLSEGQRARLAEALAPLHQQYDEAAKMLRTAFHSPGYHTTLTGGSVHPTRNSFYYAVALLDTGEEQFRLRALDILDRVLRLQDQDPASRTYGIWPWFLEEPLEQMSPPDWNWADFCGTALLQVALYHSDRIPSDLMERIDASIQHAANSIRRRNVGPGYTNIALMGTYVTMMAAALYGNSELGDYAMNRLRRFASFTAENGGFSEYNSPTYTVVALKELGRMRQHFQNAEALSLVEPIYQTAWSGIARHFHPPTRQWSGPHSRCYRTLLRDDVLDLIQRATSNRVDFGVSHPGLDDHRVALPCPQDLEPLFLELTMPREEVDTFVRGSRPVVGTTYLHPEFSLGSVNRGDLWNQRRPLLAYWGAADHPAYLRVRCLHDGYDFAAAQFFSVQDKGDVLAGLNFATDGGDTHISLDRIRNASVRARDLRVRFEFGGAARQIALAPPENLHSPFVIESNGLRLSLQLPWAALGEEELRWDVGRDDETAWLDLVLFEGPAQELSMDSWTTAGVGLALSLGLASDTPPPPVEAGVTSGRLRMTLKNLNLDLPVGPGPLREVREVHF